MKAFRSCWHSLSLHKLRWFGPGRVDAASDLKLASGPSFDDDSSPNFPVEASNLSIEGSITPGSATVIFFGTSNCWNTAREAERLVKSTHNFVIGFTL